jgi:hypothetical protein
MHFLLNTLDGSKSIRRRPEKKTPGLMLSQHRSVKKNAATQMAKSHTQLLGETRPAFLELIPTNKEKQTQNILLY